jgi:zinc and cadmium transporter
MILFYLICLFIFTAAVGAIPIFIPFKKNWNQYLLAFSGAVLLGITFLHLIPEAVEDLHHRAGYYILGGFFLQLFLQKFSHGIEHGHVHAHDTEKKLFNSIFLGLAVHAFLEGIPLGYTFEKGETITGLFIGIAAHKAPEVLTLMSFLIHINFSRKSKLTYLLVFAAMTPLAGILSQHFATAYSFTSNLITHLVPIVIGAFIHIATTIFFESGAQHHQLNREKIIAALLGIVVALLTLLGAHHH